MIIGHLLDLHGDIDVLARYITEQNIRIEKLEMSNQRLHSVSAHQYEMIQELQVEPSTVSQIAPQPSLNTAYEGKEVHTETTKLDIKELTSPTTTTAIVITVIGGVSKFISTLIPTIP
jgi:hypothetical protein